jgi:hypothetical protein
MMVPEERPMPYILRDAPADLWSQFTTKAKAEGWPLRALFLALMQAYVTGRVTGLGTPPARLDT